MSPTSSTTPATPRKTPAKRPKAAAGGASEPGCRMTSAPRSTRRSAELEVGAQTWGRLTLDQRARLMERVRTPWARSPRSGRTSPRCRRGSSRASAARRGMARRALRRHRRSTRYRATLLKPRQGREPARRREDGCRARRARACARLPADGPDEVLLSGFTGEVWFEPGVTDGRGAPRGRARAADPDRVRRRRAGARRGQRHLDPGRSTCCTNCSRTTASPC